MNSAPGRYTLLLMSGLLLGTLRAQPLCDVLLQPAFHYSTNGLTVVIQDSSRTYGPLQTATWDFGDGTAITTEPSHTFAQPGRYQACLTLTTLSGALCSATYCREIVVPLLPCTPATLALFNYAGSTTNTGQFTGEVGASSSEDWLWEFGDGSTSTAHAPAHTWALPGPHFVTLTRHQENCTSTYGRWVEVDGNGTTCGPDLFVDFDPDILGMNAAYTTNLVTSGLAPLVGIWSYGDGVVDTTMTGSHTYGQPGAYQVCFLLGALALNAADTCFSLVCRTIEVHGAAAIGQRNQQALALGPNPTSGIIQLYWSGPSELATATLFDPIGKPVWESKVSLRPNTTFDFGRLHTGSYLLVLTTSQGRYVQHVFISP